MKFEYTKGNQIKPSSYVRVKKMQHIIEVTHVANKTNGFENIQRLSKTEYMMKDTGEILEYKLSKNRADNIAGLKDTFRKIRDLINNNFTGSANELHLTLTYRENMKDPQKLYNDFKAFWKRYKRKYGNDVDYMAVVEPQGRGAWHMHVLIRHNDRDKVYIPAKELEKLWGNGFIKVKALKGVDNIGAYLSAYLGDVELTPDALKDMGIEQVNRLGIKTVEIEGKTKAMIKGGRLHMYPPGMNLYRHSAGIRLPQVEEMTYRQIKEIVGSRPPNYSRTVMILADDADQDTRPLNQVTYEQYNLKRK